MSDTDSLDGLCDDIDMDALLDTKEGSKDIVGVEETCSDRGKQIETEGDLDDLLDDFFGEEAEANESASTNASKKIHEDIGDDIGDDDGLTTHLKIQKTRDLEKALHTLPDSDMKKKWMGNLDDELKLNHSNSISKRSYSYLEWQDSVEHFTADKSLRNLILRACSKSNMSDAQAKRLQDCLFHDSDLLKKYCKLIIEEKAADIVNDCDFNEINYPALWKVVAAGGTS